MQDNNIPDFVIQDIDSILLGPEVKVARLINDHLFHAVAIRDIYDKKIAQKILHFFLHGFPDLVFFWSIGLLFQKRIKSYYLIGCFTLMNVHRKPGNLRAFLYSTAIH